MNKNIAQQGRSMIEMLGVLAIIGVLSVGGLVGYSKAMERYRVNETINQIVYMVGNIHSLFKTQRDYSDLLDMNSAIVNLATSTARIRIIGDKAQIFPASIINNDYKNVFGGRISFFRNCGRYELGDKKSFGFLYYGIPQEACIELVTKDWNNMQDGFLGMEVEGSRNDYNVGTTFQGNCTSEYRAGAGLFCPKDFPLSPEIAVTVCDKANDNSVQWHFY